jgi:hypothetical protein
MKRMIGTTVGKSKPAGTAVKTVDRFMLHSGVSTSLLYFATSFRNLHSVTVI